MIVGIKHLLTCKDAQRELRIRSGRDQQWNGGEGTPGKDETKGWQSKERLWRTKRENGCKKKKTWEVKKKSRTGLEVKSELRGQDGWRWGWKWGVFDQQLYWSHPGSHHASFHQDRANVVMICLDGNAENAFSLLIVWSKWICLCLAEPLRFIVLH